MFIEKPEKLNFSWTTADERRFIDKLGDWAPLRAATNRSRKARVADYLRAIKLRTEWGDIDAAAVKAHALARLGELTLRIQQYPHIS
jgi:hypothetical protein